MQRIYCPRCESENFENAAVCSLCGHRLQGREPNVIDASPTARKHQTRKLYLAALSIVVLAAVGWIYLIKSKELIDQAKYERLYRAGKAITAATAVGVNRADFHRLLLELNTEVEIGVDKALANASNVLTKKMVLLYADAQTAYQQSEKLWKLVPTDEDEKTYKDKLPIHDLALAEALRAKYGVEFTVEKRYVWTDPVVFYGFPLDRERPSGP